MRVLFAFCIPFFLTEIHTEICGKTLIYNDNFFAKSPPLEEDKSKIKD